MGDDACKYPFLGELVHRTSLVSISPYFKNECVRIDMSGCSRDFMIMSERFIRSHSDRFHVIARGLDIYIEIENGETFLRACEKAIKEEQSLN